jgi:hypothetical protein
MLSLQMTGAKEAVSAMAVAQRNLDNLQLAALGQQWAMRTKPKLPRRSGALRNSVKHTPLPNAVSVEASARYATFVMFGSKYNPRPTGNVIAEALGQLNVERYVGASVDSALRKAGL